MGFTPDRHLAINHVSYTEFRQRLAEYMDKVRESRAPPRVTRQNAKPVAVLCETEYDGTMEMLQPPKSPANATHLLRSIRGADSGKWAGHDLR